MNLKKMFFKGGDEPPQKGPAKVIPINPPTVMSVMQVVQGGADYNKHFDQVMDRLNLPGPDYLEFSRAIAALQNMPLTEQQKYISTYPTYASMNVPASKLVSSAEVYKKEMYKEESDFHEQLKQERQTNVIDKEAEIEKLTKEIQEKTNRISLLTSEKNNAANKLAMEENNFNQTFVQRVALIDDHVAKIKLYLDVPVTR